MKSIFLMGLSNISMNGLVISLLVGISSMFLSWGCIVVTPLLSFHIDENPISGAWDEEEGQLVALKKLKVFLGGGTITGCGTVDCGGGGAQIDQGLETFLLISCIRGEALKKFCANWWSQNVSLCKVFWWGWRRLLRVISSWAKWESMWPRRASRLAKTWLHNRQAICALFWESRFRELQRLFVMEIKKNKEGFC